MPVVTDINTTPMASELVEISAMAASPLILLFSLMRSSRKAATTHTGMERVKGDTFIAVAMASVPNPTWDKPSPIIE
ncbi:hypothetical protein SDC9_198946 [bioreactor metagenome]|uniref:Uncharacterized protein n=1 Tax=bioreactor metagenome TaxID=1076179 RepID=A0A645IVU2_9ZZZZ